MTSPHFENPHEMICYRLYVEGKPTNYTYEWKSACVKAVQSCTTSKRPGGNYIYEAKFETQPLTLPRVAWDFPENEYSSDKKDVYVRGK